MGSKDIRTRRYIAAVLWGACVAAYVLLPSSASATGALAQSFSTTDSTIVAGTLVNLKTGSSDTVEKATEAHLQQLVGVVADQPLITLGTGTQQTQVVVSGLATTIVSDINGDIKAGDKITASPLQGVGMKAISSTEVLGTAETSLSDSQTTTQKLTDKTGKATNVKIGIIEVLVNVTYYIAPQKSTNAIIPTFLLNVGTSVAGKNVSPIRVLVAFLSLLAGFIIAGLMLPTGIRSGMISIGRNPLAQGVLRRSLLDVLVTSVGLLLITAAAFYLILTF
jgi:hypothetical protein